jgi:hypothetical protein
MLLLNNGCFQSSIIREHLIMMLIGLFALGSARSRWLLTWERSEVTATARNGS